MLEWPRELDHYHPHTVVRTVQHGAEQQPVAGVRVIYDMICRGAEGEEWKYENMSHVACSRC
jgi:hypothetical protein